MRRLVTWLFVILLGFAALVALVLALALEGQPRIPSHHAVSPADVDRVVALLRQNDPRRVPPGQLRSLSLTERDVDLLVRHAARRWLGANTQVLLQPGRLTLQGSVAGPWGRWLNVELVFRQVVGAPRIETLHVGRLRLPKATVLPLLRAYAARRGLQSDLLLVAGWIEHMTMEPDVLVVTYRIDPETVPLLRATVVAPVDQQRLRAYQEKLAQLTRMEQRRAVSVADLMSPLFALAAERSAAGGQAAAENRAALLTLALFANHRRLGMLVPAANQWPQPWPKIVKLRQRHDTALHFLVSAVIAAEDGTPLADAVGLWKELADARRGGSGFSFNDLAADRAGARFGELAVHGATRLQQRVADGVSDADLLPEISDLPENLPEREFIARYGGVGGEGYNRLLSMIEARLDALPMFQ